MPGLAYASSLGFGDLEAAVASWAPKQGLAGAFTVLSHYITVIRMASRSTVCAYTRGRHFLHCKIHIMISDGMTVSVRNRDGFDGMTVAIE